MRPTRFHPDWILWLLILAIASGFGLPLAAQDLPVASDHALYLPHIARQTCLERAPQPGHAPSWSSPLALAPDGALWVVNPDAGTVSRIKDTTVEEIPVGNEPWSLAIAAAGDWIYVLNRADGTLARIDAASRRVDATLAIGPEPGTLVLAPDGRKAYVSLMTANVVAVVDLLCLRRVELIPVAAVPYALAIAADGQLYVSHLLAVPQTGGDEASDDGKVGIISVIDTATDRLLRQIVVAPNGEGFPSRNSGLTVSGDRLWLAHVRAAPDLPNGLTTMVFAALSAIDLNQGDEAHYLPLNDEIVFGSPINNPEVAIPSPAGDRLYVVAAGSDLVEVIDIADLQQPRLIGFIGVGYNPLGMTIDPSGRRGYVMNYLARSVSVLDLETLTVIDEITVSAETLDPALLRGKRLFNNASDPNLSLGSWISCASCHFDGWPDGITWRFPDGPRQTPMLWNAGATLPWHWSATLDEAQDVEETIELIQHGLGLAPGLDPPLLGAPLTGRGADLDALALFLTSGIRPLDLPAADPQVEAGRLAFDEAGCPACHAGTTWTISQLTAPAGQLDADGNGMVDDLLRSVGTHTPLDLRGDSGFDVPSLLGVGLTAPYLHDGSAASLEDLLLRGHPQTSASAPMTTADTIPSLAAFLRSIDAQTLPVE